MRFQGLHMISRIFSQSYQNFQDYKEHFSIMDTFHNRRFSTLYTSLEKIPLYIKHHFKADNFSTKDTSLQPTLSYSGQSIEKTPPYTGQYFTTDTSLQRTLTYNGQLLGSYVRPLYIGLVVPQ